MPLFSLGDFLPPGSRRLKSQAHRGRHNLDKDKGLINHFDSKFYSKIDAKHFKVNLQKWALNQILNSNIKVENVFISKNCTYCNKSKYHSYRRDAKNAGRMYAMIGWEE